MKGDSWFCGSMLSGQTPPCRGSGSVPSFLGVGVPRAGTSWLYEALREHPALWLPPIKELHYFDSIAENLNEGFNLPNRVYRIRTYGRQRLASYWSNSGDLLSSLVWDLRFFGGDGSCQWYISLFEEAARRGYLVGEVTPAYALLPKETITEIYKLSPFAKIIVILRDPVSRTWSNLARYARKYNITLSENEIHSRIRNRRNEIRVQYNRMLDNWLDVFPSENVYVSFFDDLVENAQGFIDDIYEFLGVARMSAELPKRLFAPVHAGTAYLDPMPNWVLAELANMYEPELRRLRERLAGRTVAWHDRAVEALRQ